MPTNGKKRNKNKKAPTPADRTTPSILNLDELVEGMTLTSSSSSSLEMTCFHGSSVEMFSSGSDYEKAIRDCLSTQSKSSKGYTIWEVNQELGQKLIWTTQN
jgi:hypothetical protein